MSDGNVVAVAENFTADVLHELLQLAIEGRGKLPGAKHSAKQLLAQRADAESAIARMIAQHVALAGGQGFATNWGGFVVSMVTRTCVGLPCPRALLRASSKPRNRLCRASADNRLLGSAAGIFTVHST